MKRIDETFKLNDEGDTLRIVVYGDTAGPGWYELNGKRLPASVGTVLDYAALKACFAVLAHSYVYDMLCGLLWPGHENHGTVRPGAPIRFLREHFKWVDKD